MNFWQSLSIAISPRDLLWDILATICSMRQITMLPTVALV